jgi:molybdate/tungstate transport system permease protein
MKSKRISYFNLIIILLGGLALMFIIGPLLGMFLKTNGDYFSDTLSDPEVQHSIGRTLLISFLGTLVFAFSSIPLAYLLARKNFTGKRLVTALIDLPVVIPHSAAGIAILLFISRDTLLGNMANALGFDMVGHPAGIALAMAYVSIPYLINAARDGFLSVPERYEKAALSLGASHTRVFFTVSLPLAWRSILSGFILMFGRGMSEFGAVVMVAYHPMTTPILIYERFSQFGLKYAQPVSVIFVIVCLLLFLGLRWITLEKKPKHA